MDIELISKTYCVRRLGKGDVEIVYDLMRSNDIFYQYHPPFVTRESILEDMEALPPGKGAEDKYYVGFFEGDALIALLDLIDGYPEEKIAFIGLLMTDAKRQRKGIGMTIVGELAAALKAQGFQAIRIGVDKGNPQSNAFWRKNGFVAICEETYILMERAL